MTSTRICCAPIPVAAIFKAFMEKALAGQPPVPFRTPPGIRMVRVDGDTGLLPGPGTKRIVVEAFKPGTEPTSSISGGAVIGVSANQPKGRPTQAVRPVFDASLY
jgi:penicillin-binding protein 1A